MWCDSVNKIHFNNIFWVNVNWRVFNPSPSFIDYSIFIHLHIFAERLITYDDTGQQAYENACRRYKALPSGKFSKSLQESSQINLRHYNLGSRGAMAVCIPLLVSEIYCLPNSTT